MGKLVPAEQHLLAAAAAAAVVVAAAVGERHLKVLVLVPSYWRTSLVSWDQTSSLPLPYLFLCFANLETCH